MTTIISETCGIVTKKNFFLGMLSFQYGTENIDCPSTTFVDDDDDNKDSDLEHNKVLWPFLCTLLSNAAAETLLHGFVKSLLLTKPD